MKAKRLAALLLTAVMVFSFAACTKKQENPKSGNDNENIPELHISLDKWPVIDGALAMIPYYEEMAARILDMPIAEARKYVLANNTPQAYKNLAEGTVDMVFCAPPSAEQLAYCEEKGVELDSVQVLNSGFVFFVNKDNPVNNLSSKQLYDIYAGKIKNWNELGGKNEPIIAYQRGEGSGSQTGLYEHVIPQDKVMEPPKEQKIGAMAEIIDAVASYDNASGALGFSYYYYVTNMHYQDAVKLIAVDNIYPTAETITSGMYPFISKTGVFFNKNQAEDSPVRQIAEWCRGQGGIKMAQDLGYVPSGDDATIIEGYGEAVPGNNQKLSALQNNLYSETREVEDNYNGYHEEPFYSGIKNKGIAKKINSDISRIFKKFWDPNYFPAYRGMQNFEYAELDDYSVWYSEYLNSNNILSFSVEMSRIYIINDYYYLINAVETRNYDLNTGRQIKIGDLFDDRENGFKYINTKIYDEINHPDMDNEAYDCEEPLKLAAPFKGVREDQKFVITEDGAINLFFDDATPEFYIDRCYASRSVMASKYINFDRFASKENLFDDETERRYLLIQSDYDKEVTIQDVDEDINDLVGSYEIDVYTRYSYFEDMSDYQKKLAQGDKSELEYYIKETQGLMDQLIADNHKDIYGYVMAYTYVSEIGGYVDIVESISYSVYSSNLDGGIYKEVFKLHTFKSGSDEELILYDIFQEGADIKKILINAYKKALQGVAEGEMLLNTPSSDAFISATVDNIRGFCIYKRTLNFQFDDIEALFARFMPQIAENDRYYLITQLENISFEDIGYENLRIF